MFIALENDSAEALAHSLQPVYRDYRFVADKEEKHFIVHIPERVFGEFSALILLFESAEAP